MIIHHYDDGSVRITIDVDTMWFELGLGMPEKRVTEDDAKSVWAYLSRQKSDMALTCTFADMLQCAKLEEAIQSTEKQRRSKP